MLTTLARLVALTATRLRAVARPVAFAAVGLCAAAAIAAPEPEPVPRRWQLDIDPGALRAIAVDVPNGKGGTFYYLTYKVTNNSGEDVNFAPQFELASDDGSILRSGRNVPREVTDELLKRIASPLVQTETDIQGMLLQGPENAKQGLVVWPVENVKVNEVTVYITGLSGETRSVARPDNGEKVILRKTLMLRHQVAGSVDPTSSDPFERTINRWIMR